MELPSAVELEHTAEIVLRVADDAEDWDEDTLPDVWEELRELCSDPGFQLLCKLCSTLPEK